MADLSLPKALKVPSHLLNPSQGPFADTEITDMVNRALNSTLHRERWKYSKSEAVLQCLEVAATQPTIIGAEQDGVQVTKSPASPITFGFDLQQAPEAMARLCYAKEAIFIYVTKPLNAAIEIEHIGSTLPVFMTLNDNIEATVLERFLGDDVAQSALWINLGQGAHMMHSRNSLAIAKLHWQYLAVDIGKDSHYVLNNHATGAGLRRQDIQISISGSGGHAEITSAAMIGRKNALDQQLTLEHRVPNGSSHQVVHNIVADGGKCTFNGRIHIHEGANGTNATLSNKNLGLGKHATINTKPELEIYTDDVSCAHGATIGQLSDQELFYLTSRGINPKSAQALLSEGFLRQCTKGPLAEAALPTLIKAIKQEQGI